MVTRTAQTPERTEDDMTPIADERTEIVKITDTFLGANEDSHGILTATLTVDYGTSGGGQRIGGYNLSTKTSAFGMQHVKALMGAVGVSSWEQMKGKTILVITDGEQGPVIGIQNLPTERGRRFIFDELTAQYTTR